MCINERHNNLYIQYAIFLFYFHSSNKIWYEYEYDCVFFFPMHSIWNSNLKLFVCIGVSSFVLLLIFSFFNQNFLESMFFVLFYFCFVFSKIFVFKNMSKPEYATFSIFFIYFNCLYLRYDSLSFHIKNVVCNLMPPKTTIRNKNRNYKCMFERRSKFLWWRWWWLAL